MSHRIPPFLFPLVFGKQPTPIVKPPNISDINPDPVSITQTQTNYSSSSDSTHASRNTTTHNERPNLQTTQSNKSPLYNTNPPGIVLLHHQESRNYVRDAYCSPVTDDINKSLDQCKFNRDCLVSRTKLFTEGQPKSHLSSTVYGSSNTTLKKIKYDTMDTRLVHCVNKLCKHSDTKLPKTFHYVCFMHKIHTKANDGMDIIESIGIDDNMFDHLHKDIDIKSIYTTVKDSQHKLIFPVCGKRCYNTIMLSKNFFLQRHVVIIVKPSLGIRMEMKVRVLSLLLKS